MRLDISERRYEMSDPTSQGEHHLRRVKYIRNELEKETPAGVRALPPFRVAQIQVKTRDKVGLLRLGELGEVEPIRFQIRELGPDFEQTWREIWDAAVEIGILTNQGRIEPVDVDKIPPKRGL
jgi:hypothetical protein